MAVVIYLWLLVIYHYNNFINAAQKAVRDMPDCDVQSTALMCRHIIT